MILYANIDDKGLLLQEFLPEDLLSKVRKYNYSLNSSSHKDWHKSLVTNLEPVLQQELGNTETGFEGPFEEVYNVIKNCEYMPSLYEQKHILFISYYEYSKNSGINWHSDDEHTLNMSIYIHEKWDQDWGGETFIDTGRGLPLVVMPAPNNCFVVKNGIPHKVCPIIVSEKRKVLQVRIKFIKD